MLKTNKPQNKYTVYVTLLIHPFILVMLFANVADVMLHSSKHDHVLTFRDEFLPSNFIKMTNFL